MDVIDQINSVFVSQNCPLLTSALKSIFSVMLLFLSNCTLRKAEMERDSRECKKIIPLETIGYKSQFHTNKLTLGKLPLGICFFSGH